MSYTLDATILLYASDESSPQHATARRIVARLAEGPEIAYLFWPTVTCGEGEAFWRSFRQVADDALPTGNLVPDAHLAALMLESEVRTILTRDRDFRRLPRLEVRDPFG